MQGCSQPEARSAELPDQGSRPLVQAAIAVCESATPDQPGPSAEQRIACLVRTLQQEVIPRLAEAHRSRESQLASNDALSGSISAQEVEAFTAALLRGAEQPLDAMLADVFGRGLGVTHVFLDLLAPSARLLGHLWTEDLCDFTDVTIGLGRLQRMMRELSPAFGTEVVHPPNGRRVLLVRAPGEQHSFGLSMVAEFFRRAGWEVASAGEGEPNDPVTAVRREWFDVVGFSAGSESRLEWLPACIAAVRRASCHREIAVLVGGPLFTLRPQLARQVGADATSSDGSETPGLAESLLAGRVKRS